MRVYDFAMRADVPPNDEWTASFQRDSKDAVVVDAESVAQWVHAQRETIPAGNDVLRLVERCVPPFPTTMVEFRTGFVMHMGVVVFREITDSGWKVGATAWASDLNKQIATVPAVWSVEVDPNGTPDWDRCNVIVDPRIAEERRKDARDFMAEAFLVALIAFRFMHARGVELRETQPPRHERRRAEKEGKPAPVTFKTLEIGGITRTLSKEGNVEVNGIRKAMHLCRGHFADYTKGAGLFGKHKVEVFVPEHVKGRRERGVIVKDYCIGAEARP
jgi:hypothetical protein